LKERRAVSFLRHHPFRTNEAHVSPGAGAMGPLRTKAEIGERRFEDDRILVELK